MKYHGHISCGELNDYLDESNRKRRLEERGRLVESEALVKATGARPLPEKDSEEFWSLLRQAQIELCNGIVRNEVTAPKTEQEASEMIADLMIRLWFE